MKIGDVVRQGNRICKLGRNGKPVSSPTSLGIVIDIRNMPPARPEETAALQQMMHMLGRQVDVLWGNGRLTKNVAENSLEVVSECG